MLIPALAATPARLQILVSASGVSGVRTGRKHGFAEASTDAADALALPRVDAVVIATRHNTHGALVVQALEACKHVFVEKPLAINRLQLDQVIKAHAAALASGFRPVVMVGFNRRYAPQVLRMRALLAAAGEPKVLVMTVNAGAIPANHWTQSAAEGAGGLSVRGATLWICSAIWRAPLFGRPMESGWDRHPGWRCGMTRR